MLLPQTHSPEVDYSLFIMATVATSLGVMETTPAALRRSFPPPVCSSSTPLFRCFYVSAALPSGKRRGTIFIVVFRSRGSVGKKDQCKRSHKGQNTWSHAAQESGRVGLSILAIRPPFLRIFRSYAFFLPKNDLRKFSGRLDVVWVPETQKYRK